MVLSAISSLPHRPLECPQCHWQDWIRTVLQETSKLGECLGCSRSSDHGDGEVIWELLRAGVVVGVTKAHIVDVPRTRIMLHFARLS